jgi:hypothetical protein
MPDLENFSQSLERPKTCTDELKTMIVDASGRSTAHELLRT